MRGVRRGLRLSLAIAVLPILGIMTVVSAVVMGLTTSGTAADTPTYALSCHASSIPVNLPSVVTEGLFTSDPVAPGATNHLKANPADVPNSAFGLYNASTNPTGVNLLNGPDTGLGIVLQFPTNLEPLTTPGDNVAFSGSVPLTVGNGSGSPSLTVNGSFTVPAAYPTNAAVVINATQSGTITAGSSGPLSVAEPQFTTTNPLSLTLAIGATPVPITCTSAGVETIATATNSGGSGGTTTTTTTSTPMSSTTTTTTSPSGTTTTTTAPPHPPADSPSYSLACTAATVPVNLPSAITEGVFASDPVAAGATDDLVANSKAVPNSLFGLYDKNSNPNGVNLLNGPDTGLGVVVQFPAALQPLTTPGDTVTFSGTLPLSVTGGVGTPSLNLSGGFTVPSTHPTNAAIAIKGTQSGTITAGQGTSMTISQPQFTSGSPLALTIAIGSTNVPITCTSSSTETLDTATITGGNGTPTPPNPPSPGTVTAAGGAPAGTATSANTLAFTGPGPALWFTLLAGLLLLDLGYLVITTFHRPRELATKVRRQLHH